ncbi:MAG: DUF5916 domain-containing protein, partial [Candidatus Electryonea clarkiae]|nr:DUF5916 domain-containing protein [Candidatus Electryonea clarkiae]
NSIYLCLLSIILASPATGFTQFVPHEGKPPHQETRVYILYTKEAICVAFHCLDSAPDSISGRVQRRDKEDGSDIVYISFDTFHDMRNAYFFGLTAAGVQLDGTFTNEVQSNMIWDGVWESAVSRQDDGWVAEMRIPFSSFRHGGAHPDGWGMIITRQINRYNEWVTWQPASRQRGLRVNEFGVLDGLEGIESSMTFEVLPHVIGRWDQPAAGEWGSRNEWENLGIDLKIIPSSTWTVDLTYEPDFAQVDVDEEVINLSDYPVYLSEKRPFFMEGLGLFGGSQYRMLYTRKITDPQVGIKVTGQGGAARMSGISAKNITDEDEVQAINAGRITWNLGRSTVGYTGTSLVEDHYHANTSAVDTRIRWGKSNNMNLMLAGLDRTDSEKQPVGAGWELYLESDHLRGSFGGRYKGEDFDINDLGFDSYSKVVNNWNWMQYSMYPEGGKIEVARLDLNFYHEAMPNWSHYEKSFSFNGSAHTRSNLDFGGGMNWGTGFYRNRPDDDEEYTDADYPFHDNFDVFRTDKMAWYSRWLWFGSDERKPVDIDLEFNQGTHREGHTHGGEAEIEYRPFTNLELAAEVDWKRIYGTGEINDGALTDYIINRFRTRWSPTLNISIRGTVQFDKDEEMFASNLLFAWNWNPGSWFYIVYDESRNTDFRLDRTHWHPDDRTIRMKWTYFFTVGL